MSNKPLMRGLLLAVVLFAASASGAIAAPVVGASGPLHGSGPVDGTVTGQPDRGAAEVGTPMVDVADRRGPERSGTAVALLTANVVMLGVGAVLLWRRCATEGPVA